MITVVVLLVRERELFDTPDLEPLFSYLQREGRRPDIVASSHHPGALRAALEIQYTFETCAKYIEPLPEISGVDDLHGKGLDGPIAIQRAFRALPRDYETGHDTLLVVVSESAQKVTEIYQWIGGGERPRPVPDDLTGGDFIVLSYLEGELCGFRWSGELALSGVP